MPACWLCWWSSMTERNLVGSCRNAPFIRFYSEPHLTYLILPRADGHRLVCASWPCMY